MGGAGASARVEWVVRVAARTACAWYVNHECVGSW